MIVWCITGNEIGDNGCGAAYFATKREAEEALRTYRKYQREKWQSAIDRQLTERTDSPPDDWPYTTGPEKLVVTSRESLAALLNDAMGYGGS